MSPHKGFDVPAAKVHSFTVGTPLTLPLNYLRTSKARKGYEHLGDRGQTLSNLPVRSDNAVIRQLTSDPCLLWVLGWEYA